MDYDLDTLIDYCDDCERMHEYTLWRKPNGHLYLTDSDGDVTPILRKEADELIAAQEELWTLYLQDVAETGDDYLGHFVADQYVEEWWHLQYAQDERGVRFIQAKQSGGWNEWLTPGDPRLPRDVQEYATATYGCAMGVYVEGLASLDALYEAAVYDPRIVRISRTTYYAPIKVHRSAEDIQGEIKQRAKAALEEETRD